LERCAEIPQEAGRIQFDPVDLVSFIPVTLERSRGRDFEAGIAVFGQRNAYLRLKTAAASEI
jgi:hypothetical protein